MSRKISRDSVHWGTYSADRCEESARQVFKQWSGRTPLSPRAQTSPEMGKEGVLSRRVYVRTAILLIGGLGVLALPTQADTAQPPLTAQEVGRPSKLELLTRCQQRPACRAKIDAIQKGQKPAAPRPMVQAQSAVSVYLTPRIHAVLSPYSDVELHGVLYAGGRYIFRQDYRLLQDDSSERRPFVAMNFTAPASAYYIINVRASNAAAKLRHISGGAIIETWASGSAPCSAGICDYVTIEYLQQGAHKFYFYSPTHEYTFYSASIESYP